MLSYAIDGDRLTLARLRKGWTVRDVSARCGELGRPIDFGTYARYERRLVVPSPVSLAVVCQALEIDVADVLIPKAAS